MERRETKPSTQDLQHIDRGHRAGADYDAEQRQHEHDNEIGITATVATSIASPMVDMRRRKPTYLFNRLLEIVSPTSKRR